MIRRVWALLPLLLAAAPAAAQPAEPPRLEPVVVTVTRMEQRADEAPVPPTGKQVAVSFFAIVRIENGTLAEEWGGLDVFDLLQQLTPTSP